jgi:hypothetical protein
MKISISLLTGFLLAFTVNAQIRMPIWGWSSPNEKLILSFHSQKKEITADRDGKWHSTMNGKELRMMLNILWANSSHFTKQKNRPRVSFR